MKKLLISFLLLLALIVSACGNNANEESAPEAENETPAAEEQSNEEKEEAADTGTITYQSEDGPVEVPANPQRVIALFGYAGYVLHLDVPLVGVDGWSKGNPNYNLEGVEEVTEDNLEKIIELEPDLILGLSSMKNIDKMKEIAPVVTFTYGQLDYLNQYLEVAKVLNKEAEAQAWIDDFKTRTKEAGEEIKAKIGEDATVTVIENFDKELYVFGDNWARGTEILYQEMGLKMPEKVKEMALEPGYYTISLEVLPEYVGDYLVVSKAAETETSFLESETFNNIPAVKNGNVFVADATKFYFSDPITLDYQLDFFKEAFLGN